MEIYLKPGTVKKDFLRKILFHQNFKFDKNFSQRLEINLYLVDSLLCYKSFSKIADKSVENKKKYRLLHLPVFFFNFCMKLFWLFSQNLNLWTIFKQLFK